MNLKWMENVYQKFEAACHEVDEIVGKDAVKFFENRVQNVGDSMKNLYSEVVRELRPFPTVLSSTKDEANSVDLKNNTDSSVKSVGGVKDNNKNVDEENPVNNCTESLKDSTPVDIADDQQAGASIKHDHVNQVRGETFSDSMEVENDYTTQEEAGDNSRETSEVKIENLHATSEETSVESEPKLTNLIPVEEKEPHIYSVHSESYSGFSDSVCGDLVITKDNVGVNVKPSSCLVVDENNTSIGEKESTDVSLFSEESSDVHEQDTHGILPEVSPATSSLPCERPPTETESLCIESSLVSESPYSKSQGSCFEIHSCKNNSGDGSWCISDNSMVHVCGECSNVTGQILESQDGLVSTGCCLPMESNDESLISSFEFNMDYIQLDDDVNLEESCVFVDDSELHAVSCRVQKLRSYKKRIQDGISSFVQQKRIQDAFAPKKRTAKTYEQVAIWYGDTEIEYSQGSSRTVLPFRLHVDSKKLQEQQASEPEWELL